MIHIKQATDGQYYFVLVAKNNKVLMTSETYCNKSNAVRGANRTAGAIQTTIYGRYEMDIIDATKK